MNNQYGVFVVDQQDVSYDAVIDQTARFDGLYDYIWPYNHGDIKGNIDARSLHRQRIRVIQEISLNTGQQYVSFMWQNKPVWLTKEAIVRSNRVVANEPVSELALIKATGSKHPLYKQVPLTTQHAHIPIDFTDRHEHAVRLISKASTDTDYVGYQDHQQIRWLDAKYIQEQGHALPSITINGSLNELQKGEFAVVSVIIQMPIGDLVQAIGQVAIQGNYTADFPRKNFELTLFTDFQQSKRLSVKIGDWPAMSKFSLRGDYTDETHVRNTTGYELWREILATEQQYVRDVRDQAMLGTVQNQPILLSIDGEEQGIYTLGSYLDAESLQLSAEDDRQVMLMGVNGYIGNKDLAFSQPQARLNEADFSVASTQLPDNEQLIQETDRLMAFVHNASDAEFKAHATEYFDPLNLIDYLLFVGAINAYDNVAHNQFLFTYDGRHWLFTLIDLDISFNIEAAGKLLVGHQPALRDIEDAPLLKRIWHNFPTEIHQRWYELRQNILSEEHIIEVFQQKMTTIGEVNYKLDQMIWQSPTGSTSSLANVQNFVHQNLPASDKIIDELLN